MSSKTNFSNKKSAIITVNNISKEYLIYKNPEDRLKQAILPKFRKILGISKKDYFRRFWALGNVSFEVSQGEVLGIVGRNGSGKSTLLQIITGTLSPSSGNIDIKGRVAALLELGSGFNPDFTGRENVYLNASVLGLSQKEIDERFEQIIDFANIGDFIDQPVKTYSSGMTLRLAFAVQSQIEPEILIIDEALAVGDAKFQAKCFERLRQLKQNGTSIILVTHSTEQIVTHCDKALLLNYGNLLEIGEPKKIVNKYLDILFEEKNTAQDIPKYKSLEASNFQLEKDKAEKNLNLFKDIFHTRKCYNPFEYRWGDKKVSINDFLLIADQEYYPSTISIGQKIFLSISVRFHKNIIQPIVGITIKTKEGITVYGTNSEILKLEKIKKYGLKNSVAKIDFSFSQKLAQGDYFISLGIASWDGGKLIPHDRRYDSIHLQVGASSNMLGLVDLELEMDSEEIK